MPCESFSYPNGNWSQEIRDAMAYAGFKLGVTTERGIWFSTSDELALPRMNMYEDQVIGPTGKFSPMMFDYRIMWRGWWASKTRASVRRPAPDGQTGITSNSRKPGMVGDRELVQ